MSITTITSSECVGKHDEVALAPSPRRNGRESPLARPSGHEGTQPSELAENGLTNRIAQLEHPLSNGDSAAEKVVMVGIERFVPNDWNPNRMTEKRFEELCAEVRHIGQIAKPVRARPISNSDSLEIIDGEHNLRAAKRLGLAAVPCVIEDMDDFEAMRQTYKRNQGGKHGPLLEGELFQRMKKTDNMSNRELSEMVSIPESTIRNRLKYVEAWELRRVAHTAEDERAKIGGLSLEQVRAYLDLPAGFRDRWLDAGAAVATLHKQYFFDNPKEILTGKSLIERISFCGLADLLETVNPLEFALKYLGGLALWCGDHSFVEDASGYAHAVGEFRVPLKVLECLPYAPAGDGMAKVMLSSALWLEILRSAAERKTARSACSWSAKASGLLWSMLVSTRPKR